MVPDILNETLIGKKSQSESYLLITIVFSE